MMDIEKYLRDNKPEMPEEGQFLIETNARLSNIEGLKNCVDADRQRGRQALVIALLSGLILGCLVTLLITRYPIPPIEARPAAFDKFIAMLHEWEEVFIALIAGCSIVLGVMVLVRKKEAF